MNKKLFVVLILLLKLFLFIFLTPMTQANDENKTELDWRQQQVKIIYNLSKFVTWPIDVFTDEHSPFHFCLLGVDSFQFALEELVNLPLRGRPIEFHQIKESTLSENENCQVLFVSQSLSEQWQDILKQLENKPILTVSDMPEFAHQGGMIGLIPTTGRVRFKINVDAARAHGLLIRAPLLKMAQVIHADE
ncbi:YfiR family protein [Thioflexithrix psekupsensis]|nr:YfiR family protein [Thioflexithrix psekupsensis]